MSDEDIDYSDIPELDERFFKETQVVFDVGCGKNRYFPVTNNHVGAKNLSPPPPG